MVSARIVLKKAKTYTLRGRHWIENVPQTIKGETEVEQYQANGYFHVTVLKHKAKPKMKVKASVELDVEPSRKAKKKKKKGLLRKSK